MTSQNNSVTINAQYIKDVSFENPKVPYSFQISTQHQPSLDIALDINAKNLKEDNTFEVTIGVHIKSIVKEEVIFILELEYAGIFTLDLSDPSKKEEILLVSCPGLLFPYVRRVISDITRDCGHLPVMLNPIDFFGLYIQRKQTESENNNIN